MKQGGKIMELKKKSLKKVAVLAISLAMILGNMPVSALATGTQGGENEPPSNVENITALQPLAEEVATQKFIQGGTDTPNLPGELMGTLASTTWGQSGGEQGEDGTVSEIAWTSSTVESEITVPVEWVLAGDASFSSNSVNTYVYTASIDDYLIADGVEMPVITAMVEAAPAVPMVQTEEAKEPPIVGARSTPPTNPEQSPPENLEQTITAFGVLGDEVTTQTITLGDETIQPNLPSRLAVTVDGQEQEVTVEWNLPEGVTFTKDQAATYHYTPTMTGYLVAEGVNAPTITVNIVAPVPQQDPQEMVQYTDANGNMQSVSATVLVEQVDWNNTESNGYYVAKGQVNIPDRAIVTGDVHLILAEGAVLNVPKGITVTKDNQFTIYEQVPNGTGRLYAGTDSTGTNLSDSDAAGIGGGNGAALRDCGTITINGGIISANAGGNAAGIGSGYNGDYGTININGGIITAKASSNGEAIGKAYRGSASQVNINGGSITVDELGGYLSLTGNPFIIAKTISDKSNQASWSGVVFEGGTEGQIYNADFVLNANALIPAGYSLVIDAAQSFTVKSGITLTNAGLLSNKGKIANHGTIANQGRVVSSGEITGNPIQGGIIEESVTTTYYNPTETSTETVKAASITSDMSTWSGQVGWYVADKDVRIDSRVTVSGDVHLILANGATLTVPKGITVSKGNSLTIYAQTQVATGTLYAGTDSSGGRLAESGAAGIGGGSGSQLHDCGTITINGGSITAQAGTNGYGIGPGSGGNGGAVSVNGGMVIADGGAAGWSIGGSFRATGNAYVRAYTIEDKSDQDDWSGIVFEGGAKIGKLYGDNLTLETDATIPEGYTLIVEGEKSLALASGVTLTNQGTLHMGTSLSGEGTLAGEGKFTISPDVDDIEIADQYYTGVAIEPEYSILTTTKEIKGIDFTINSDSANYGVSYDNNTEIGMAKISLTDNTTEKVIEVPFNILEPEKEIKTYRGDTETSEFVYGETITIKVTPKTIVDGESKMGIYIGDELVTELKEVTFNQEMEFDVLTTHSAFLMNNNNNVTAKYTGMSELDETVLSTGIMLYPKQLTWEGMGQVRDKVYNGSTIATVTTAPTLEGIIEEDSVAVKVGTASFIDKNVGTDKVIVAKEYGIQGEDAINYIAPVDQPTFEKSKITAKQLSWSAVGVNSKQYDGTTDATVTAQPYLIGKISGDDVGIVFGTIRFEDENAGSKKIIISDYGVDGEGLGNYILPAEQPKSADVTIVPKQLTWTSNGSVEDKGYDGTTVATIKTTPALSGVVGEDKVSVEPGSVSFADKNAGENKAIVVSGYGITGADVANYHVPKEQPTFEDAEIKPVQLTWSTSGTVSDKIYNGTEEATQKTAPTLEGIVGKEDVVVKVGDVAFKSADAGTHQIVVTDYTAEGEDIGNYLLPINQPTFRDGSIQPKQLTWTLNGSVEDKVYDGTTVATIQTTPTLSGIVGEDKVSVETGSVSFADKNAGENKAIVVSGYGITGADIANYHAPKEQPTFEDAEITKVELSWTQGEIENKTYDGTTTATVKLAPRLETILQGDEVTIKVGTVRFESEQMGTHPIIVEGYGMEGEDAINYALETLQPSFEDAKIGEIQLTWGTAGTTKDKVYDGDNVAESDREPTLIGVVSGDQVSVKTGSLSFQDKNIGTHQIQVTGYGIQGEDAGKYLPPVEQPTFEDAEIKPVQLIWATSGTVSDKIYNGTEEATQKTAPTLEGIVGKEDVVVKVGDVAFKSADAGTHQIVVTDYTAEGEDIGNYLLPINQPTFRDGSIQPKQLTWTLNGSVEDKVYDGTTVATIQTTPTLSGIVGEDKVSVETGSVSFADKNAGENKAIVVSGYGITGADVANYHAPEAQPTFADAEIKRATPSGNPTYRIITSEGKSLASAKLATESILDVDGMALVGDVSWDAGESQVVEANISYSWTFIPKDSINYYNLTGTITPYQVKADGTTSTLSNPTTQGKETEIEVQVSSRTDGDASKAQIEEVYLEDAVEEVLKESDSRGTEANLTIKVEMPVEGTGVEVTFNPKAVEMLLKDMESGFHIETRIGKLTFDNAALKSIVEQGNDRNITIIIREAVSLSAEQKEATEGGLVYELLILVEGNQMTDFGGGVATVSIPYMLDEGEKAEDVVVYFVAQDGELSEQPTAYNEETEMVVFTTTHFSHYVIKVEAEEKVPEVPDTGENNKDPQQPSGEEENNTSQPNEEEGGNANEPNDQESDDVSESNAQESDDASESNRQDGDDENESSEQDEEEEKVVEEIENIEDTIAETEVEKIEEQELPTDSGELIQGNDSGSGAFPIGYLMIALLVIVASGAVGIAARKRR